GLVPRVRRYLARKVRKLVEHLTQPANPVGLLHLVPAHLRERDALRGERTHSLERRAQIEDRAHGVTPASSARWTNSTRDSSAFASCSFSVASPVANSLAGASRGCSTG